MRPPRDDIALPPFPDGIEWIGGPAPRLDRLVADAPLLVHFFDFAQLNSLRALPYVREWSRRYAPYGLGVLGVHSARYPFTEGREAVAAALPRLEIAWTVAVDPKLAIWRDYGCQGWPSLFLWGRGGALRWYHLGEGEYEATEAAIRESLTEPDGGWPAPLEPLRPGDAAGETVIAPTPEIVPGGSLDHPWPLADSGPVEIDYEAAGAYAAVDGRGELRVTLDDEPAPPIDVRHPALHELASHGRHERHRLTLEGSEGINLYSLQFAPGPAPD